MINKSYSQAKHVIYRSTQLITNVFVPAFVAIYGIYVAVALSQGESFECAVGSVFNQSCLIQVPEFGIQIGTVFGIFAMMVSQVIKIASVEKPDDSLKVQ